MYTETDLCTARIRANAMSENEFFAREIEAWKHSAARLEQLRGADYYAGRQDILQRERTAIGPGGRVTRVDNLPCHRVVDNQYAKMVDQKVNYLLGRPLTFRTEDPALRAALQQHCGPQFRRLLKHIGEDALNGGIAWLYVAYDSTGALCFRHFPAHEILPFWADDAHTQLDAAARLWRQELWEGPARKIVERVELFLPDGLHRYILENGELLEDTAHGACEPWITARAGGSVTGWNWQRLPLIAFRYDRHETPLIRRVKSLQDGINALLSGLQNNMEEDARNTILVLQNYDGENLGEFRYNLATYGAVKVRDDGGVQTLQVQVSAENYATVLELFKKALIENARGFDAKDDRLAGNPNQLNIQSMYSDIDLDASGMETEFQAALTELLWFVRQDLRTKGQPAEAPVEIIFNRDVLINEAEAISSCAASVGLLSQETIVAQHPWVEDVEAELARIRGKSVTDVTEIILQSE